MNTSFDPDSWATNEASPTRLDHHLKEESKLATLRTRAISKAAKAGQVIVNRPECEREKPITPTQQGRYAAVINRPLKQLASSVKDRGICESCGGETAIQVFRSSKDGVVFVTKRQTTCLKMAGKFGTTASECEVKVEIL